MGFARLRERLQEANTTNPEFSAQFQRLREVVKKVLRRLEDAFPGQIERVLATGDWARYGFDLRNMPFEEVLLLIVVDLPERPFALYLEVARRVFVDLGDEDVRVQFQIETAAESEATRQCNGEDVLGIPLAVRT